MNAADLQSRINPMTSSTAVDLATNKPTSTPSETTAGEGKVNFLNIMQESGKEIGKEREAKKNGDLSGAKNYDEFLQKLSEQSSPRRDPKNVLGKDDFLKLFVTQLQHQDPLNPDDGAEMASKLAQFNSLEQMMNMNKTLEQMVAKQSEGKSLELINYIGKEVVVDGGRVRLKGGVIGDGSFNVKTAAAKATLEVRDSAGVLVHQSDMGSLPQGTQKLQWNGLLKDGQKAGDGIYTFSITATGLNNETIPVDITTNAQITGVDIKDAEGAVFTNLGRVKFSTIKSVGKQGYGAASEEIQATQAKKDVKVGTQPEKLVEEAQVNAEAGNEKAKEVMKQTAAMDKTKEPPMISPEDMAAIQNLINSQAQNPQQNSAPIQSGDPNMNKNPSASKQPTQAQTPPQNNPNLIQVPASVQPPQMAAVRN